VSQSPWPLLVGFGVLGVIVGIVKIFVLGEKELFFLRIILVIIISIV